VCVCVCVCVSDAPFLAFVMGDLNVAHHEIDLHNPKGSRKSAGFTDEVIDVDHVERHATFARRSNASERHLPIHLHETPINCI
jgi:exonuclease III